MQQRRLQAAQSAQQKEQLPKQLLGKAVWISATSGGPLDGMQLPKSPEEGELAPLPPFVRGIVCDPQPPGVPPGVAAVAANCGLECSRERDAASGGGSFVHLYAPLSSICLADDVFGIPDNTQLRHLELPNVLANIRERYRAAAEDDHKAHGIYVRAMPDAAADTGSIPKGAQSGVESLWK
ncbi:uncharacterized protein LOC113147351 [Cyclospora cayetanensis]|uniref:Uncharacterized protein LOC113147351 n=1 Tax=Cyclospora cayetanensis TaxID=88456 RepID=A0A6P6S181_9EIME|nr:uncharacterized protein LOC113147351 [Cyclospora cayetanensis]